MPLRPGSPHKTPFDLNSRSDALIEPKLFSVFWVITMSDDYPSDYKVHDATSNVSLDHCRILKGQDIDWYIGRMQMNVLSEWINSFPIKTYCKITFPWRLCHTVSQGTLRPGTEACKEAIFISSHISCIALAKLSRLKNNSPEIFSDLPLCHFTWDKE